MTGEHAKLNGLLMGPLTKADFIIDRGFAVALGQEFEAKDAEIADLRRKVEELTLAKPLYSRRQLEARAAALEEQNRALEAERDATRETLSVISAGLKGQYASRFEMAKLADIRLAALAYGEAGNG